MVKSTTSHVSDGFCRTLVESGVGTAVLAALLQLSACASSSHSADGEEEAGEAHQAFKNQFLPNLNPIHESITLAALPFLKSRVANYIAYQNAVFDAQNIRRGDAHFDNCLFRATSERAANNLVGAVINVFDFPADESTLPDSPYDDLGVPHGPIPGTASLAKFASVLHAMQDFYAHTNWVESGQRGLFAPTLGNIPVVEPYSDLGGLIVLDGDALGWSIFSTHRSYPSSVLISARFHRNVFPALISGTTTNGLTGSWPKHCPSIFGRGLRNISHDYLAKDDSGDHPAEHILAVSLATQQTSHEWCRFVDRVYAWHGSDGVRFLCENWVRDAAAANATCPTLSSDALCPASGRVRIRALIDGRSQLLLRGDSLWWRHFDYAAPGMWLGSVEPTEVWIQPAASPESHTVWCPDWPSGCNTCDGSCGELRDVHVDSLPLVIVDPPLPTSGDAPEVSAEVTEGRGTVNIVQYPDSTNNYTLALELDDNPIGGAAYYEVAIDYAP